MQRAIEAPRVLELTRKVFRHARRTLGFRIAEVAQYVGITEQALSQFEIGKSSLSGDVLGKIADKLNGQYRAFQLEARETVKREERLPIHLLAFGFNDPATLADDSDFLDKVAGELIDSVILERRVESEGPLGAYLGMTRDEIQREAKAHLEHVRAERKARAEEIKRRRWIARLEKVRSKVNDPVLSEVIRSFRRELDSLEEQVTTLKKKKRD